MMVDVGKGIIKGLADCQIHALRRSVLVSFLFLLVWFSGWVWFGLAWFGLARLALLWPGLAWFGLAWFGLAWFGSVRFCFFV